MTAPTPEQVERQILRDRLDRIAGRTDGILILLFCNLLLTCLAVALLASG